MPVAPALELEWHADWHHPEVEQNARPVGQEGYFMGKGAGKSGGKAPGGKYGGYGGYGGYGKGFKPASGAKGSGKSWSGSKGGRGSEAAWPWWNS